MVSPSDQLLAALLIGSATVSAAVVNATTQLKLAREARRNSKPAPTQSRRMMRWLTVGAAVALGLGWSATTDGLGAADGSGRRTFIGAGVTSMLGGSGDRVVDEDDGLIVASLELHHALTEEQTVALLHAYNLRPYAIDLRLAGDAEAWAPVATGRQPAISVPRARADAERRAWQQACALESVTTSTRAGAPTDSLGVVAMSAQPEATADTAAERAVLDDAVVARRRAERLSAQPAVIHAIRVLATASAATHAAQDAAVERAEIMRYDPGWPLQEPTPISDGCDMAELAAN